MKLSSDTLAVLKNFASINSNVVFRGGSTIKTMSEAKNILASAEVAEVFPSGVGLYDLNEFLGVVGMFDEPDLEFYDNYVRIGESNRGVQYFFSDPSILTSPTKDIKMPDPDVTFTLSESDLSQIRRAASTLSVSDLVVEQKVPGETELTATVTDLADSTSNSFSLYLAGSNLPDVPFRFVFNVSNFKIIPGDYQVDVSSKLISQLTNRNAVINYWIALEKSSTFGN